MNRTPVQIWESFSFRQIGGFFRILMNDTMEEWRMKAALHGVQIKEDSLKSKADKVFDFTSATPEEWSQMAGQLNGMMG